MMYAHIGISVPTRVLAVVRNDDKWEVWIAMPPKCLQQPRAKWLGTFLCCHNDGSCTRVTIYPDGSEQVITVKGPDK